MTASEESIALDLETLPSVLPLGKIYSGAVVNGKRAVTVRGELGILPLRCLDFFTPRFAWGYHAGAPEELAIAILHDHFGSSRTLFEGRVLKHYLAFADEIVSKFERDHRWSLASGAVAKWVAQREKCAVVA